MIPQPVAQATHRLRVKTPDGDSSMPWYSGAPLYGEAGVTVCALASWLTSISKWLAPQGVAGSQGMKRHGTWGKGTELDLVPRDPVGLSPRPRRHKSCE